MPRRPVEWHRQSHVSRVDPACAGSAPHFLIFDLRIGSIFRLVGRSNLAKQPRSSGLSHRRLSRKGRCRLVKVGIPSEVKNNEFRVAITPAGVYEFARAGHEVFVQAGAGRRLLDHRRATSSPAGATILPDADEVWATARPDAQGQGADRRGVPADARRSGALHLPAPGRVEGVHRRAARPQVTGIAYETVELPDRVAAAARPDVRGRRAARAAGRRVPPDALRRRPRRADGRRPRGLRGQGRGDRRRRVRHERRRDRARHAGRGAGAGPQHRPAAGRRRRLPRPPADHRVQRVRDREGRPRRRPGDRRGAGPRREGTQPDLQRAGVAG